MVPSYSTVLQTSQTPDPDGFMSALHVAHVTHVAPGSRSPGPLTLGGAKSPGAQPGDIWNRSPNVPYV